ncbi:hypothetical protein BCR34DRAFT_595981 [Clohesyomyces aquaticus]|uniref:Mitochondrial carrier domain-containing protein n=1 Tax=Clohesyomyces aquaticus TaxID=1231657 RepID=A0A1Y2A8X4_9PLEO|nr:hypothetical protein BCR34DRAFT_595981 [Clohesyomyces aquaticus]
MPALAKSASASAVKKSKDVKKTQIHYPFWFGGSASCAAACFTHPLDLIKVFSDTSAQADDELTTPGQTANTGA